MCETISSAPGQGSTCACTATICMELRGGLAPREADRRIAQASRLGDVGARVLAFYLSDMADRGAQQALGFHSVIQYAETRFGIQLSTTREYLAVGRALRELPRIDEALCAGRLTWSAARLLARVADRHTEAAWIRWARGRSVREIASGTRSREKGDRPTDPAKRRIHDAAFRVEAALSTVQFEIWCAARAKLEAETGSSIGDTEVLMEMARQLLSTQPDGSVPGRRPVNDSHFQVHVYHVQAEGLATTLLDTGEGPVELDVTTARAILLAAGRGDLLGGLGDERADDAGENDGPDVPESQRDAPTPPELRARVLARDRYRCRCCESRENLTVHHKKWRRKGGRTRRRNLLTLCEGCHSLVHARLLVIRGAVEGDLRFTDRDGCDLSEIAEAAGEALRLIQVADDARASDSQAADDARASTFDPATPDPRASARITEPAMQPFTIDDVPDVITPRWWQEHQHLLELGRDCVMRVRKGATVPRRTPGPAP